MTKGVKGFQRPMFAVVGKCFGEVVLSLHTGCYLIYYDKKKAKQEATHRTWEVIPVRIVPIRKVAVSNCSNCKYISNSCLVHPTGYCRKLDKDITFSLDKGKCKEYKKRRTSNEQ